MSQAVIFFTLTHETFLQYHNALCSPSVLLAYSDSWYPSGLTNTFDAFSMSDNLWPSFLCWCIDSFLCTLAQ